VTFVRSVNAALLLLCFHADAFAGPWLEPGDVFLRANVERLSRTGAITAPVTSWPIPLRSIGGGLGFAQAPGDLAAARLDAAIQDARRPMSAAFEGGIASDEPLMRHFSDAMRGSSQISAIVERIEERAAVRLALSRTVSDDDAHDWRLDGSYAAGLLGGWAVRAGATPRWWGPGWDSALVLSTNARPVPAIALERMDARPFEMPWLAWIGPWRFETFLGQLEGDRDFAHARLWGARLEVRPLSWLEIGFSRAAQWGGNGRPGGLSTFGDVILGTGENTGTLEEPGNQLAAFDARVSGRLGSYTVSAYAELAGEDEAGGLPGKHFWLGGVTLDGVTTAVSWLVFIEASDTEAGGLPNTAYEHHIYRNGYRYRDHTIGSTFDNDSHSASLGAVLQLPGHVGLHAVLRRLELNRDGANAAAPGGNPLTAQHQVLRNVSLELRVPFQPIEVGVQLIYAKGVLGASRDGDNLYTAVRIRYGF
jgi:hypothetical protein